MDPSHFHTGVKNDAHKHTHRFRCTHTHTYANTNMQSHTHTEKRTDSTCTPFHVFGSLFLTVIMHKLTVVYVPLLMSANCRDHTSSSISDSHGLTLVCYTYANLYTDKTMTSFRALLTAQIRQ